MPAATSRTGRPKAGIGTGNAAAQSADDVEGKRWDEALLRFCQEFSNVPRPTVAMAVAHTIAHSLTFAYFFLPVSFCPKKENTMPKGSNLTPEHQHHAGKQ